MLLQNVQVLAAGKTVSSIQGVASGPATSTYSTITLAVTPAQAELLIATQVSGRLFCVLRNRLDGSDSSTSARSLKEVLSEDYINRLKERSKQ